MSKIILILLSFVAIATGATITWTTGVGAVANSQPVAAEVVVQTTANMVEVWAYNQVVNPTSVGQNMSSLSLTFGFSFLGSSLSTSTANLITINADGTFTSNGAGPTGWVYVPGGSGFGLDVLAGGGAGPENTIVGHPDGGGVYSAANASLKNNPHNPQLALSGYWRINAPGVTSQSVPTGAITGFGTASGNNVTLLQERPPDTSIPEPATWAMIFLGLGLVGVKEYVKRRRTT